MILENRKAQFLEDYKKLCENHGYCVVSCGCCDEYIGDLGSYIVAYERMIKNQEKDALEY